MAWYSGNAQFLCSCVIVFIFQQWCFVGDILSPSLVLNDRSNMITK